MVPAQMVGPALTLTRLKSMRNRTLSSLILLFGALLSSEVAVFAEEKAKPAAEDSDKLLAEKESKRGPTFPGDDPAFLVLPRPAQRSRQALELLTPEVRQMNERALVFLARAQDADGSWSDTQFPSNTGVTALACLAFMAEGSRPRIGKFGKSIDLGLEFILKNVQTSGVIAGKGSNKYGPMYEHAYSMLALLYSFGDMPWRPQTRDVISRGIQAMLKSQRLDGGWRYQFSREGHSDMSVTANVLWVLRTAKKSGFTVSQEAIDRGIKFVEQCANPDGSFRYRYFGIHASPSLGGTGIIALCNHGRIDHPLIPTARDRIEYDYRRYTVNDLKERRYFVFGCFYASLATYMSGDAYWMPWFKKAVKVLATMQRKDGEIGDQHDNTIYSTAMASIVLQAPKGYLPIYER